MPRTTGADNKTQPTSKDVKAYLDSVPHEGRREDADLLLNMMTRITGEPAVLWGPSIIGFGRYHYVYDSGREGDHFLTGFAPRKSNLVIYIMPGYGDFDDILADLGKFKLGKSCLYINKLADIDQAVLERLIRAGLEDLKRQWEVFAA